MKPLSDQQRLFLVESDQLYRAWREAYWRREDYKYGLQWKHIYDAEYLVRPNSAGSSRSLGRRSSETEKIYQAFVEGKEIALEKYRGLTERLELQKRLNRATRLGRMPSIIGEILVRLDQAHALSEFRVVGTHALFAYEAMAAVEFKIELLASGDVDLMFDSRKQISIVAKKFDGQGLLGLLKKVDKTFEAKSNQPFRAVNKDGFMVDLVSKMKEIHKPIERMSSDDLEPVEIPNLEWLMNAPKIDQVVIAANGSPVLMPVSDPRAFAIHKAWLSKKLEREPVKKQRDLNQAIMVYQLLNEYLPNLPFDTKMLKYLPKEVTKSSLGDVMKHLTR